uniref:LIM and calponin homology domains 1 n=1 Tax=Scleropages formosus TaxID=113540 RepID=A0A8C9RT43_SCLFO
MNTGKWFHVRFHSSNCGSLAFMSVSLLCSQAVTGRRFGDKDFRGGLENGILLCELLSSIKPGLVKKINRLPTPIAGLDNLTLFLRGCEELGLKGSQLFDPGDLQDTSIRANPKVSECSRKLKNVLITIYWLGKAANSCATYNGPTLDLKEFEGLLSQMRKEAEDSESPKRSVRDSGYIDCWDSERSDSLSPPRHGRDDSFDSLDSFGSRSQQTPSPDVVIRRGSDSESDAPHRKLPDVRKDDMLARRTSYNEPRSVMPFNQYLPNKSNQSAYVPTPLRKKRAEREDGRKSWSTATSPIGGERPLRSVSMIDMRCEEEAMLQPHSQTRHELMHNQYNKMREEEDHWQDDLARWKSRRRSASQDLIKKEEERKMMEKLMSGDGNQSHRRRSIKTYKEIVEEKEKREQELHEAYRKARTPEEAAAILQRYALRFTISEAVLERLQIPKQPERLPSTAPPSSVPVPKFTSTVETMVGGVPEIQAQTQADTPDPAPTRTALPKTVPLLTPKPYTQPRSSQTGLKSVKADGMVRVNGEAGETSGVTRDIMDQKRTEGASPVKSTVFLTPSLVETPDSPRKEPQELKGNNELIGMVAPVTSPLSLCAVPVFVCVSVCALGCPSCQIPSPMLGLVKRVDHWSWDPEEERKRQERWQQEQERMLQEKYQREQEKLKQEWEKAQREVEEEERRYHEEERRILEETVAPLTPRSSALPSPIRVDPPMPSNPQDAIVRSLADWERKQELLEEQVMSWGDRRRHSPSMYIAETLQNGQRAPVDQGQTTVPQLQFIQGETSAMSPSSVAPCRSVSGKKLCSSCAHPLGKGAAMIIETLGLYFHIQCFKCGICKGQLGDTSTGTDVRIRNGLLNCHECYMKSRAAGQPTTL